jgi:acyl-CoA synthetase (AMP-forming)/AMP-acid ligase II
VLEVAVVGRPDPVMGEEPIAFAVATAGHALDTEELLDSLRTVLAKFKIPKEIKVVDSLPRNAVGKILKPALREALIDTNTTPDRAHPPTPSDET